MSTIPQTSDPAEGNGTHPLVTKALRLAAADQLLDADRARMGRAVRGRHRAIVAAWNAGHSESHIAERLSLDTHTRVDRRAVHRHLVEGAQSGELTRPLRAPRVR